MATPSHERAAFYQEMEERLASIVIQDEFVLGDERLEKPAGGSFMIPTCSHGHVRFCPPSCRFGEKPCPGPWQAKKNASGCPESDFD